MLSVHQVKSFFARDLPAPREIAVRLLKKLAHDDRSGMTPKTALHGGAWGLLAAASFSVVGPGKFLPSSLVQTVNSLTGPLAHAVFSRTLGENVEDKVAESHRIRLAKVSPILEKKHAVEIGSFADIDRLAADQRFGSNLNELLDKMDPGKEVVVHEQFYDTPGKPKYSLVNKEQVLAREVADKASGSWDSKVDDPILVMKFIHYQYGTYLGVSTNPEGNTKLMDYYYYARQLKNTPKSFSEKRKLLFYALDRYIGDDQTLESAFVSEVVTLGAGVCRAVAAPYSIACNLAGVPSECRANAGHIWVESRADDGSLVTVDPNFYGSYFEIPFSRGGTTALSSYGEVRVFKK